MNRLAWTAVAVLLLPIFVAAGQPEPLRVSAAKVVGVSDGDTVTVLDVNKQQHKIRLFAIDAPESKQAYGSQAKQALSEKILGKDVRVVWKQRDTYGRVLGIIYLGNRNVNMEMVAEGWAWHYKHYDQSPQLAAAELKARQARLGLWADTQPPLPPWDFRRQQEQARQQKHD